MKYNVIIFFFVCLISANGFADNKFTLKCFRTPELLNRDNIPKKFLYSNNLEKAPGSFDSVDGVHVVVHGTVFDQGCVPLQNAILSLWQPTDRGVYDKSGSTWSGRASTDNLGRFKFLTVKSALSGHSVPYVNMLIEHVDFVQFETTMFFDGEPNEKDRRFGVLLHPSEKPLVTANYEGFINGAHTYEFNVVVGGYSKFRHN